MTVHVVMGAPCSGKSSFVDDNAPNGAPRFDFDRLASTVAGMPLNHSTPDDVTQVVLAMRRGLLGWLFDQDTRIGELWVVMSAPSAATLSKLGAMGAVFHVLNPGEAECIARANRDNRPEGTIERIKQWYADPPQVPDGSTKGNRVKCKDFTADVKTGGVEGEFTAYASVFDVKDSYGDVLRKGAFTRTLDEWQQSGNIIPVLYGHDFKDPFSNIGQVTDAIEDDHGLKVTALLDLDNPTAAQVYKLLKQKRLTQMSFAFDVVDHTQRKDDGGRYTELTQVKLYEVSVVPIGANQETEILAVKAAQVAQAVDSNRDGLAEALSELSDSASRLAEVLAGHTNEKQVTKDSDDTVSTAAEGVKNRVYARLALQERTYGR